jgi:hypothetical protein
MAVKVMVAPAIVARRDAQQPPARSPRSEDAEPKAKRRRSSVYDADGNEVFITLVCLKCHRTRPLSQFGLRKMADGAIRNQPWCRTCRGATTSGASRQRRRGPTEVDPVEEVSAAPEPIVDAGRIAAQVVAALHGGRR